MKYLIKNTDTNIIALVYDMPVQITPPLESIEVPDDQFEEYMLRSIFVDVNNWKEYPGQGKNEGWWESDGTDWFDNRSDEELWEFTRNKRGIELSESDWTQLADTALSPTDKGLWTAYRNILRNTPNNHPNDPRAADQALDQAILNDKPVPSKSRTADVNLSTKRA